MKRLLHASWRITVRTLFITGIVSLFLSLLVSWLLFTTTASQWLVRQALSYTPLSLEFQSWQGNLYSGWQFQQLTLTHRHDGRLLLTCQYCQSEWQLWPLLAGRAYIKTLDIDGLKVYIPPESEAADEPMAFPMVYLPLAIELNEASLTNFALMASEKNLFSIEHSLLSARASGYDVRAQIKQLHSSSIDAIVGLKAQSLNLQADVAVELREPLAFDGTVLAALGSADQTAGTIQPGQFVAELDVSTQGQCLGGSLLRCYGAVQSERFFWPAQPSYVAQKTAGDWYWQGSEVSAEVSTGLDLVTLFQSLNYPQDQLDSIQTSNRLKLESRVALDLDQSQLTFEQLDLIHQFDATPAVQVSLPSVIRWAEGIEIEGHLNWRNLSHNDLSLIALDVEPISGHSIGSVDLLFHQTSDQGLSLAVNNFFGQWQDDEEVVSAQGAFGWQSQDAGSQAYRLDALEVLSGEDFFRASGRANHQGITDLLIEARSDQLAAYHDWLPGLPSGDLQLQIQGGNSGLEAHWVSDQLTFSQPDNGPKHRLLNTQLRLKTQPWDDWQWHDITLETLSLATGFEQVDGTESSSSDRAPLLAYDLELSGQGGLKNHQLVWTLSARESRQVSPVTSLTGALQGSLDPQGFDRWQGQLQRLRIDPLYSHPWRLQEAVSVDVSAQRLKTSILCLEPEVYGLASSQQADQALMSKAAEPTQLCNSAVDLVEGSGDLKVSLANWYLARDKTVIPALASQLDDNLWPEGHLDVSLSAQLSQWQLTAVQGEIAGDGVRVAIREPDLTPDEGISNETLPKPTEYDFAPLRLALSLQPDSVSWQSHLQVFERENQTLAGRFASDGQWQVINPDSVLNHTLAAGNNTLAGQLKMDWPDLHSAQVFAPDLDALSGHARALIDIRGTLDSPDFIGSLEVDGFGALIKATGTRLANWRLHMQGSGEQFNAKAEGFAGSDSHYQAQMGTLKSSTSASRSSANSLSDTFDHESVEQLEGLVENTGRQVGEVIEHWRPKLLGRLQLFNEPDNAQDAPPLPDQEPKPSDTPETLQANASLTGQLTLSEQKRRLDFQASGRDLHLVDTGNLSLFGDLDLSVSGEGRGRGAERLEISGDFSLRDSYAEISELPEGAISKSDDEVIVDVDAQSDSRPDRQALADVRVRLADNVRFKGFGLEALLSGDVRVQQDGQGRRKASGQLRIDQGSYRTFNQKLQVSEGRLLFTGDLDNPQLRLTAQKQYPEALVGVKIQGTASSPQSALFSEPYLSEADKLSYLLTGKPVANAGDALTGDLQAAALNTGLQALRGDRNQLEKTLRITDISVESDIDNSAALALGSQINDKIYVKYLYGLVNRTARLVLEYRLNKNFSLETSTGESQAVDAYYRWQSKPPNAAETRDNHRSSH